MSDPRDRVLSFGHAPSALGRHLSDEELRLEVIETDLDPLLPLPHRADGTHGWTRGVGTSEGVKKAWEVRRRRYGKSGSR